MSSEQALNTEKFQSQNTEIFQNQSIDLNNNNQNITKKIPIRVNINHLLVKLRQKEKLQKKENLLFLSLGGSIIIIFGIICSL